MRTELEGVVGGTLLMVNFPSLLERKSSSRRRVGESNWHLAGRATPISCQTPAHTHIHTHTRTHCVFILTVTAVKTKNIQTYAAERI